MIRRLLLLPLAAASMLLAACQTAGGEPPGAASDVARPSVVDKIAPAAGMAVAVGNTVVLQATWSLIVAEEFYQAANRTALTAVRTGMLPNAILDRIQELNRIATSALQRGKSAASHAERARAAAEAMTAALELRRIGTR